MKNDESNFLGDYVTVPELAKALGVSVRTVQRWAQQRSGPPLTPVGHRKLAHIETVRSWLKHNEQPMVRERRGRK